MLVVFTIRPQQFLVVHSEGIQGVYNAMLTNAKEKNVNKTLPCMTILSTSSIIAEFFAVAVAGGEYSLELGSVGKTTGREYLSNSTYRIMAPALEFPTHVPIGLATASGHIPKA
jgi:hypothetical protein